MKTRWLLLMALLPGISAGQAADPATAAAATTPRQRAQAAALDLSRSLKAALAAQLERGGTVGAITFCHDEAPRIAARVAAEHRLRIGRVPVAGRQRSPANTAEPWQAQGLAVFEQRVAAGTPVADLVQVQDADLPAGVDLRLLRGIPVEPMCLACHGKALADDTRAALQRLYPGDGATGFSAGDLRGALWVEVPTGR
ncbi:DUF3365 domain-containing protein [Dokdonella sp.]|uniref:c-type heme family protein n=1 Tax=Dokdonella sp. TaxID=2291710 RepID=UPI0027B8D7B3|nr:DUF3365 domain-containing protein [Dokdonella sp.]